MHITFSAPGSGYAALTWCCVFLFHVFHTSSCLKVFSMNFSHLQCSFDGLLYVCYLLNILHLLGFVEKLNEGISMLFLIHFLLYINVVVCYKIF